MNLDPNPQPKPNLNNPSKLLDTINLLAYNVRYGWICVATTGGDTNIKDSDASGPSVYILILCQRAKVVTLCDPSL